MKGFSGTLAVDLKQSEPFPKRPAVRQRSGRSNFKSYIQYRGHFRPE